MELPKTITIDEVDFDVETMEPVNQVSVARIQELRAQLASLQQQGSEITLLISAYGDALKKALTAVEEPEEVANA